MNTFSSWYRPGANIGGRGGQKNFDTLNSRVWANKQKCSSRISWILLGQDKKGLHRVYARIPTKSGLKTPPLKKNTKTAQISTNSAVKIKKKDSLHLRNCCDFPRVLGWNHKKNGFSLQNLQKTVLAHEFWGGGDDHYFGSLRPRIALQGHRACYFLWSTILAWGGHNFRFGGHKQWFGITAPECPPVAPGLGWSLY